MVTNFFRRYINTSKAPSLEKLVDRSLLKLCGHDCISFLQGLVTNDVTRLQSGKSMFALFLNNRGRVLYDSLLYKDENNILLECDTCSKEGLLKHLRMYRLRKKVDFYEVNDHVWVAYNTTDACLEKLKGIQFLDPRSTELGWRVYAQDGHLQQNCEVGYCRHRYMLGIAEGSSEYGNTMPLEMNCDYLNGVSFDKGCYIGQELTARTHHTGIVRKRLMPLILKESDGSAVTDLAVVTAVGQVVGKVRAQTGDRAIALMRVSEALENADALYVEGTPATTYRPHWWPQPNHQYVSA